MGIEDRIYNSSPRWVRDVLMNLHGARIAVHRYGRLYRSQLEEFDALSRGSLSELADYQSRQFNHITQTATEHSPYYRQLLAEVGFAADGPIAFSDLKQVPILTKSALRENLGRILTRQKAPRTWLHGHTSGTTGSPLSLWYDRQTCIATNAADRLQKRWAGIADDEWIGVLLGRQVVPNSVSNPPFWHANYVQKQVWFSSLHMSPRTLPVFISEIRRRKLKVLEGYPSTLFILAKYLLETGQSLELEAVFSSSETLLDVQREAIQSAFSAPLFDFYGHAERTVFAIECKYHVGKHIVSPFGVAEIVDANNHPVQDGEFGYIVGTSLHNTAMPMLRYRTGDVTAIDRSPCACGSTFPRIVGVSTKAEDIVVLPDGRWLSPSALTHPFKPFPEIVESQIVQEQLNSVVVRVVATSEFNEVREAELMRGLRQRFSDDVELAILRVDRIPREKSGKFRWVISKVSHDLRIDWE